MNLNNESIENLQLIYNTIYKNANELIDDGIILLENNKFARSHLCFQIALEEFGKLPMINTVAFKVFNKEKVDWKHLNKRLRNHYNKNTQTLIMSRNFNSFFSELYPRKEKHELTVKEIELVFNQYKKMIKNNPILLLAQQLSAVNSFEDMSVNIDISAENKNMMKNHSLYADFYEKKFLSPSDIVTKKDAKTLMVEALIQKHIIEIPKIHETGFKIKKLEEVENNTLADFTLKNIRHWEGLSKALRTKN